MSERIPSPEEFPTLSVPDAGRMAFDLGRAASYEAAKRGELPTIVIGRRVRVPTAQLRRRLGLDVDPPGEPHAA